MDDYHFVWLSAHPERTPEWLEARLAEGFHIHHLDFDHSNNDQKNLVLIEGGDHMMLHNGSSRLLFMPPHLRAKGGGRRKKIVPTMEELREALAKAEEKQHKIEMKIRKSKERDNRANSKRLRAEMRAARIVNCGL